MIISDIALRKTDDFAEFSANISPETWRAGKKRRDFRIWFRVRGADLNTPLWGDVFLVSLLPACMFSNERLHVEAPVSRRLLETLPKIQKTYRAWFAGFNTIPVTCTETHGPLPPSTDLGTATLFSGGVDSWYTLLKHRPEITHLLLIRGFDVKNDDDVLWEKATGCVMRAAESFGKTAVFIETNLKKRADISHKNCAWGKPFPGFFWSTCLGGALSAVSLCLQGVVSKSFIPSSYQQDELFPHGTHPDLDPLWSTDDIEIIHDGTEKDRIEKIRAQLVQSSVALQNIRVCWQNIPNVLNCCRCEKCIRTMLTLKICGVLEQSTAFHQPFTASKIRRILIRPSNEDLYRRMMQEARAMGDSKIADAIAVALGDKFSLSHIWALVHQCIGENLIKRAPSRWVPWIRWAFGPVLKHAEVPHGIIEEEKETAS